MVLRERSAALGGGSASGPSMPGQQVYHYEEQQKPMKKIIQDYFGTT